MWLVYCDVTACLPIVKAQQRQQGFNIFFMAEGLIFHKYPQTHSVRLSGICEAERQAGQLHAALVV